MRSMEYLANSRTTQIYLALDGIEQVPYESPSVFNYYTPTHQPSGVIGDSGLVSPEAQLLSTPSSIAYLMNCFPQPQETTILGVGGSYLQHPGKASGMALRSGLALIMTR